MLKVLEVFLHLLSELHGASLLGDFEFWSLFASGSEDFSFQFFIWFSDGCGSLGEDSEFSKSVLGFVFQKVLMVLIDQAETDASSTSVCGLKSVDNNILLICFEFLCQVSLELVSWDTGDVGVDNIQQHLSLREACWRWIFWLWW